jgi:hypothetical protein
MAEVYKNKSYPWGRGDPRAGKSRTIQPSRAQSAVIWVPLRRAIDSRERFPQLDRSHGLEEILSSPQSVIRALVPRPPAVCGA